MTDHDDTEVTAAVKPQRRGPRNNTCAKSSLKRRMDAQLAGILAHLERHPHDNLSRARVDKIKAMGL